MFIALLSSNGSIATKYMSLNNKSFIIRPTVIDLNPIELNWYSFGSCNVVHDLSAKICVSSKTEYINDKVILILQRE